jgi:hypothetical protein
MTTAEPIRFDTEYVMVPQEQSATQIRIGMALAYSVMNRLTGEHVKIGSTTLKNLTADDALDALLDLRGRSETHRVLAR